MLRFEAGRGHVAAASGWAPAAPLMDQVDRLFLAFEAMIAAKVALATEASSADPQAEFEEAGGIQAWAGLFQAYAAMESVRPTMVPPCTGLPISP